jgi:hypothetical protein
MMHGTQKIKKKNTKYLRCESYSIETARNEVWLENAVHSYDTYHAKESQ